MDRDELRAIQKPLKERYREEPGAAVITLNAEGVLGDEEVSCSVATGRAIVEAGLHPATGGDRSQRRGADLPNSPWLSGPRPDNHGEFG